MFGRDLEAEEDMGNGNTLISRGDGPLGSGASAVVYPCKLRVDKPGCSSLKEAAVKCVLVRSGWEPDISIHEMEIWGSIPEHENVVPLYAGKVLEPERRGRFGAFFVCQRMDCNLKQLIFDNQDFANTHTYGDTLEIFEQVVKGLDHIHKNGLYHLDLKPENVLISKDEQQGSIRVKITDFDCSKQSADGRQSVTAIHNGTRSYMAPEVLGTGPFPDERYTFTQAVDIFSLGVLMWVFLNKEEPGGHTRCTHQMGQRISWPDITR